MELRSLLSELVVDVLREPGSGTLSLDARCAVYQPEPVANPLSSLEQRVLIAMFVSIEPLDQLQTSNVTS